MRQTRRVLIFPDGNAFSHVARALTLCAARSQTISATSQPGGLAPANPAVWHQPTRVSCSGGHVLRDELA